MRPSIVPAKQNPSQNLFILKNPKIAPLKQNCSIQRSCQSCQYVNQDYKMGLETKFNKALQSLADAKLLNRTRVLPPHASEKIFNYRATVKLAIREDSEGSLTVGLFQPGTHNVVDMTTCPLHVDILQKLIARLSPLLKSAAKEGLIKAWNEQTQEGDLRYFIARASHLTDEVQIVFVTTSEDKKSYFKDLIRDFRNNGIKVVSAFLNINTSNGNHIFGDEFIKIAGQEHLRVTMNGSMFGASPASFLQVNPWQAEQIYKRIAQLGGHAEHGEQAWDLYCGIGPIALSLAKQNFRVWGVEENPHAIHDAKLNALRYDKKETQMSFTCGLLENELSSVPTWAENPSLIVVNPSRRGLAENVRETLRDHLSGKKRLQHLIYVSCEVKTLARDLESLLSTGARLNQIEAFDMFPHTEKLEWLAVISPAQK